MESFKRTSGYYLSAILLLKVHLCLLPYHYTITALLHGITSAVLDFNRISTCCLIDVRTVSLSQPHYTITENSGYLPVTITLNSTVSEDVIVEVTISDGSANGNVE